MARFADSLMGQQAFARGYGGAIANLQRGGQMAYSPKFGEYVNNQQYVRKNLICLLLEAPRGFASLPDSKVYVGVLRALVEEHAMSITGLNAGLTVDVAETAFGGGGQVQEDFTDVKEERSNIVFRFNEKYGMPVQRFFDSWIRNLMMDPHSKFANINTFAGVKVTDMLADQYSATMIFIEPNPNHSQVNKAWLVTNMWPKGTGEVTGARDITQPGETVTYDINFAGIAQYGAGVNVLAQQLLDAIKLTDANPSMRPAFITGISPDVAATGTTTGYENNVETLGSTAVKL